MTHVTCTLTAKNWDQLQNPTLGNQVWATFLYLLYVKITSVQIDRCWLFVECEARVPRCFNMLRSAEAVGGISAEAAWCEDRTDAVQMLPRRRRQDIPNWCCTAQDRLGRNELRHSLHYGISLAGGKIIRLLNALKQIFSLGLFYTALRTDDQCFMR